MEPLTVTELKMLTVLLTSPYVDLDNPRLSTVDTDDLADGCELYADGRINTTLLERTMQSLFEKGYLLSYHHLNRMYVYPTPKAVEFYRTMQANQ